jgi:DNA polymerase
MLTVKGLHGQELPVWTLDFETFYEEGKSAYSLRSPKLSTFTYVRDPRFKAHGASFISPEGESFWVTHAALPCFFASIDWSQTAMLCQNTLFDGFIAREHYGVEAAYYLDTMSMSYGIWGPGQRAGLEDLCARLGIEGKIKGELEKTAGIRDLTPAQESALVPYCIQDSEKTLEVFELMLERHHFPEKELHIIDLTIRGGVVPKLEAHAPTCRAEIEAEALHIQNLLSSDLLRGAQLSDPCVQKLRDRGMEAVLGSSECFAELLRSRSIAPPMKPSPTHPEQQIYAFGKKDLEFQALQEDPRVSDLILARVGVKSSIRSTRAQQFLDVTHGGTKTLPVPLKYCGARTHRWSGTGGYNCQNLPSGRDGRGQRLREAIRPPEGYRLVAIDLSAIECRATAWVWDDEDLLNSFRNKQDPYSKTATEIFGVPVSKHENYELRSVGKAAELSLGFGVGWEKFYHSVRSGAAGKPYPIEEDMAKYIVNFYRTKRRNIVRGWALLTEALNSMILGASHEDLSGGIFVGPKGAWTFSPHIFDAKGKIIEHAKVWMPNGLHIPYNYLRIEEDPKRKGWYETVYNFGQNRNRIYGAMLLENLIQSTARSIVAEQAIEVAKRYRIVLLVHDEIVYLAPEDEADEALDFGLQIMRTPPTWCADLPLDAEGHHAGDYKKV